MTQTTDISSSNPREINSIQQDRIEWWRQQNEQVSWRLALARAHREQEIRLQAATYETARRAAA